MTLMPDGLAGKSCWTGYHCGAEELGACETKGSTSHMSECSKVNGQGMSQDGPPSH